jgi:hypothetical protein
VADMGAEGVMTIFILLFAIGTLMVIALAE